MFRRREEREALLEIRERVIGLEHEAELMRTVLIVKEPQTVVAAKSYDGLRKQVMASAAERRSHLNQLVSMAVAVRSDPPVGGRVLADASIDRLADQVRMSGVPPVLLQVVEEACVAAVPNPFVEPAGERAR